MWIYFQLLKIASFFGHSKARKLVHGEREAMATLKAKLDPNSEYVWFHAASVGEFEQGRPIIEKIKKEHPELKILLTFFSPSGYELRKNYALADIVVYLPFATRKKSRAFLDLVKPKMAIFIKYEFWPNYLRGLKKRGIPTYIVAAIFRKSQTFFHWYGKGYRKCLYCFTHLFVQDKNSADLLAKYGIKNVSVLGDPRFDRVNDIAMGGKPIPMVEQFTKGQPTLVAGSTWPPDEEMLVRYYLERKNFKLVLVPHEIHEGHLHQITQLLEGHCIRLTEATERSIASNNCMIVDTMGMLSSIYRYATVTYIGGGFGVGIHNTLEPAVYGLPVIFGPNYQKFREARGLIKSGGAFSVKNYEEFKATMDLIFAKHRTYGELAGHYVTENLGSCNAIYSMLFGK